MGIKTVTMYVAVDTTTGNLLSTSIHRFRGGAIDHCKWLYGKAFNQRHAKGITPVEVEYDDVEPLDYYLTENRISAFGKDVEFCGSLITKYNDITRYKFTCCLTESEKSLPAALLYVGFWSDYTNGDYAPDHEYVVELKPTADGLSCKINNKPSIDGLNTTGKFFFIDRKWTTATEGYACVTITRDNGNYGFVSGYMWNERLIKDITPEGRMSHMTKTAHNAVLDQICADIGEFKNFTIYEIHCGENVYYVADTCQYDGTYIIYKDDTGVNYSVIDSTASDIFATVTHCAEKLYDFASLYVTIVRAGPDQDPNDVKFAYTEVAYLLNNEFSDAIRSQFRDARWRRVRGDDINLCDFDDVVFAAIEDGIITADKLVPHNIFKLSYSSINQDKLLNWGPEDVVRLIDSVLDYNKCTARAIHTFIAKRQLVSMWTGYFY